VVAIIDYGVGNLFSISRSFEFIGEKCVVTNDCKVISSASHIVLPGVGAFGDAMKKLTAAGLIPTLDECVSNGIPFLGVCLGMQLLYEKSYEYGTHDGLGYLKGEIYPIQPDLVDMNISLKIPHMGWNSLKILDKNNCLMRNTKEGEYVYFVHSFYAKNCSESIVATTEYGVEVPAVTACGNVFGCQFHPEKSGKCGLGILSAFAELS